MPPGMSGRLQAAQKEKMLFFFCASGVVPGVGVVLWLRRHNPSLQGTAKAEVTAAMKYASPPLNSVLCPYALMSKKLHDINFDKRKSML